MIRPLGPAPRVAVPLVATLAVAGCLDPMVSDEPGLAGLILPAGSQVASANDDSTIDRQIDRNDGVDGEVLRIHGFAGGEYITYWDFGPVRAFAAPLFLLVRENPAGDLEPIGHPTIIDAIPGDIAYSPFWVVMTVTVTERYQGELLTSFGAVQEAQRLGLVEAPVLQNFAVNCPAVASNVTVEIDSDEPPLPPPSHFFWRGMTVNYFDFGSFALDARAEVPVRPRYLVRREGGEPVNEVVRGVDITGDGDHNDTNDVFPDTVNAPSYSPVCQTVTVAVQADTEALTLIDTSGDQMTSDIRGATDLFDPDAVPGTVIAFEETDDLRNCPQQRVNGEL